MKRIKRQVSRDFGAEAARLAIDGGKAGETRHSRPRRGRSLVAGCIRQAKIHRGEALRGLMSFLSAIRLRKLENFCGS